MFRSILISVSFAIACKIGYAQNLPPILQTAKPAKGIYRTFDEFRNNAPSIHSEFQLVPRSKGKQFMWGGSDYDLLLANPKETYVGRVWGASDGDSVFVNVSNFQGTDGRGFLKFDALGRYCYTKGRWAAGRTGFYGGPLVGGAVVGVMSSIPREGGVAMNINNGEFLVLDKDVMNYILSRDKQLYANYKKDAERKDVDVRLSYIEQYNRRHADEIGLERVAKVILYRREKKERLDTVKLLTNDSIHYYSLSPGQFYSFNVSGNTLTICAADECHDYPVAFEGINYYKCLFREGDNSPQFVIQDPAAAELVVKQLEKRKR